MGFDKSDIVEIQRNRQAVISSPVAGRIVRIREDGKPLVDFPGNRGEPVAAKSIISRLPNTSDDVHPINIPVFIAFDQGSPQKPVILGIIRDALESTPENEFVFESDHKGDVNINGKRVSFEAKDEILLSCGKSSLTLRKDGKIILKGVRVVSRASQENKIKGASVKIN